MTYNVLVRISGVILLITCLFLPCRAAAEGVKVGEQKHADYRLLSGKWQRPDGGYILKLSDVGKDGKLRAEYFNPRSINVSKAEWRVIGDRIQVFVELRDINYPGSTYTLIYLRQKDQLEGYYYQAATGQTFEIVFVRAQ